MTLAAFKRLSAFRGTPLRRLAALARGLAIDVKSEGVLTSFFFCFIK